MLCGSLIDFFKYINEYCFLYVQSAKQQLSTTLNFRDKQFDYLLYEYLVLLYLI